MVSQFLMPKTVITIFSSEERWAMSDVWKRFPD